MNASRFKFPHAAIRLPSGDVFVAGGAEFPEVFRSKERIFVNVAEGFEAARYFASATLLDYGRVLVVGGYSQEANGLPATSRAWLYHPIRSIRGSAPFTYVALTTAEKVLRDPTMLGILLLRRRRIQGSFNTTPESR